MCVCPCRLYLIVSLPHCHFELTTQHNTAQQDARQRRQCPYVHWLYTAILFTFHNNFPSHWRATYAGTHAGEVPRWWHHAGWLTLAGSRWRGPALAVPRWLSHGGVPRRRGPALVAPSWRATLAAWLRYCGCRTMAKDSREACQGRWNCKQLEMATTAPHSTKSLPVQGCL